MYQVLLGVNEDRELPDQGQGSIGRTERGQDTLEWTGGQGAASVIYTDQPTYNRLWNGSLPVVFLGD